MGLPTTANYLVVAALMAAACDCDPTNLDALSTLKSSRERQIGTGTHDILSVRSHCCLKDRPVTLTIALLHLRRTL